MCVGDCLCVCVCVCVCDCVCVCVSASSFQCWFDGGFPEAQAVSAPPHLSSFLDTLEECHAVDLHTHTHTHTLNIELNVGRSALFQAAGGGGGGVEVERGEEEEELRSSSPDEGLEGGALWVDAERDSLPLLVLRDEAVDQLYGIEQRR